MQQPWALMASAGLMTVLPYFQLVRSMVSNNLCLTGSSENIMRAIRLSPAHSLQGTFALVACSTPYPPRWAGHQPAWPGSPSAPWPEPSAIAPSIWCHQFDVCQVHRIFKILLHNRKKFSNFALVLGISFFSSEKLEVFVYKVTNFQVFEQCLTTCCSEN